MNNVGKSTEKRPRSPPPKKQLKVVCLQNLSGLKKNKKNNVSIKLKKMGYNVLANKYQENSQKKKKKRVSCPPPPKKNNGASPTVPSLYRLDRRLLCVQ